jgi:hypothetical protein
MARDQCEVQRSATRSATRSAGGRGGRGEPSGVTSVWREEQKGQAGRIEGRQILEEHNGNQPCPNLRQQRRDPGKEVGNGRKLASR